MFDLDLGSSLMYIFVFPFLLLNDQRVYKIHVIDRFSGTRDGENIYPHQVVYFSTDNG